MSFKIKKPSFIIKANKKRRANRQKAILEKQAEIQKKLSSYQDKCNIEDSKLIANQTIENKFDSNNKEKSSSSIIDNKSSSNPIQNKITIIHQYNDLILETSCPAQIVDDLLIIDENKCETNQINKIQIESNNNLNNDSSDIKKENLSIKESSADENIISENENDEFSNDENI